VKADGLCGLHLVAKKRAETRAALSREREDANMAIERESADLSKRLGVSLGCEYSHAAHGYTGRFTITRDELLKLAGADA
jgi:hypothetical protein